MMLTTSAVMMNALYLRLDRVGISYSADIARRILLHSFLAGPVTISASTKPTPA